VISFLAAVLLFIFFVQATNIHIRDEYLTITEFAEQNKRTRKEIEKLIDSGKLKYFRKSPLGYIYIHKDEKLP